MDAAKSPRALNAADKAGFPFKCHFVLFKEPLFVVVPQIAKSRCCFQPLSGQVAFVTGASQGIGQEIAMALSRAGARIGLAARNADNLARIGKDICREQGANAAVSLPMDVTNRDQVRGAVKRCEEELGPITILVNCAGIMVRDFATCSHFALSCVC